MLATLISLVTGLGVPARFAKPVLAVAGALLILGALWGGKCAYDSHIIKNHDQQQEINVLKKEQPANDNAATARANDTVAISKQEEEAHNAIHSVPDAAPAAPSVRLGCQRLRRAGKDLSRIPACAGLASGH